MDYQSQELAQSFDSLRIGLSELDFQLRYMPTEDDYGSLQKISFLIVDLYQSERDLSQSFKDLTPDDPKSEVFRAIVQSMDTLEEFSVHLEKKTAYLGDLLR